MTIDDCIELCGSLPGAESDIKWVNDLVFSVSGKMFCIVSADPDKPRQLSFKVDDDRFLELTDRPGIRPAPYLARAKWISLLAPSALPPDELSALLRRSHALIVSRLPKRVRAGLMPPN